jgi:hypothetical protein
MTSRSYPHRPAEVASFPHCRDNSTRRRSPSAAAQEMEKHLRVLYYMWHDLPNLAAHRATG